MIELSHVYFSGAEPEPVAAPFPARRQDVLRGTMEAAAPRLAMAPEALPSLLTYVLEQSGLDPLHYQAKPLRRRLSACLRALQSDSEPAALTALRRDTQQLPVALNAMLIGVSSFFRDTAVFEHLERQVLPAALRRDELRVLSFGCSTGQELYSIGMLLDELGGLKRSRLMGVDCRFQAIAQARAGWFEVSELETLSAARIGNYFHVRGRRAFVTERLKAHTSWATSRKGEHLEGPWDLILFRNVAIYLTPRTAWDLWTKLASQLKPGGVLVTGKAERPPPLLELFRESASVYRKPEPA